MWPDLGLFYNGGRKDGLQESATYNPPGPTKPGPQNQVTHSLMLITHIFNLKFPAASN